MKHIVFSAFFLLASLPAFAQGSPQKQADKMSVVEALEAQNALDAEAIELTKMGLAMIQQTCAELGQKAFNDCCDNAPNHCNDDREYQVCNNRGNRVEKDCNEQRKREFIEWLRDLLERLRRILDAIF